MEFLTKYKFKIELDMYVKIRFPIPMLRSINEQAFTECNFSDNSSLTSLKSWSEKWHCRLRKWVHRRISTIADESRYRGPPEASSTQRYPFPANCRLEKRYRSGGTTAWPDRRSDDAFPLLKSEQWRMKTSIIGRSSAGKWTGSTFFG